jgi:hypothetical protein
MWPGIKTYNLGLHLKQSSYSRVRTKYTYFSLVLTGCLRYWPQKGLKSTSWAIYPVLSVAISLKKYLVSPWLISSFFYYGCTVVRWREMYVFFENDLFDPGIGYFTPQISLNKTEKSFSNLAASQFCFFRSNKSTTTLQF